MTGDPKRWCESGLATPRERELIRNAPEIEPPPGAADAVWASLLARLPPPPPGGGGGATNPPPGAPASIATAAKAGGVLALWKGAAVVVVGGAVVAITQGWGAHAERVQRVPAMTKVEVAAPANAPAPSSTTAGASRAPASELLREPAAAAGPPYLSEPQRGSRATVQPSRATISAQSRLGAVEPQASADLSPDTPSSGIEPAPPDQALEASHLLEESRALAAAREALRTGDISAARALLADARARYPHGALNQEREALEIETLSRGGDTSAARSRAADFLRAYPTSPHAAFVQTFLR